MAKNLAKSSFGLACDVKRVFHYIDNGGGAAGKERGGAGRRQDLFRDAGRFMMNKEGLSMERKSTTFQHGSVRRAGFELKPLQRDRRFWTEEVCR